MAVVWQNSFDGIPGTYVSGDLAGPGNSGDWGDPIVNLRNSGSITHVRYGAQAYHGRASLALGATEAFSGNHGDVQITQPVGEWSVSFYLHRSDGGWFRFLQDGRVNVSDLYLDFGSGAHFVGWTEIPSSVTDELHDRWVRVEGSQAAEEVTWRFWWTDPNSTGPADAEISAESTAVTGYLFVQGGGSEAEHPPAYMDSVRIGEGEWLGPWPTHHTLTASASLPLAGAAEVEAQLTGDDIVASASLPLSGGASITRHGNMDASEALPLSGRAQIVRHATVDAAAGLALSSSAEIVREGRFTAGASLPLAAAAEMRSQFRPTFPPRIVTELLLDGEWVDISGDVRATEPVAITRGRADEASTADPSTCSLTLDNRAGRYSPHNPLSPYYGQIGKNTPIRVRVGPLPEEGETVLADGFTRTVTGGWGAADSGQEWQVGAGPAGAYSVSGGQADMELGETERLIFAQGGPQVGDFDATFEVSLDGAPGGHAGTAVYVGLHRGEFADSFTGYGLNISFRADAGAGVHIAPDITVVSNGDITALTQIAAPIPRMRYTPGEWLAVRAHAVGPELRIRVWPAGEDEPDVWHAQAHDDQFSGGVFGLRGQVTTSAVFSGVASVRELQVRNLWEVERPDVVRFMGEVSSWPARWDVADVDVTAPIEAAGILRRLGQGASPIQSALRRTVPSFLPIAYWPMEEGRTARFARSPLGGVQPMRVTGLRFAEDDSLDVSRSLPTVGAAGATIAAPVPYIPPTDGWEIHLVVHLPDEPEVDPWPHRGEEFLTVESTAVRATASFLNTGDEDNANTVLWWQLFTLDGDEIDDVSVSAASMWGGWKHLVVRAAPSGGSTNMSLSWFATDDDADDGGLARVHPGPPGSPSAVMASISPALEGASVGHVAVWGALYTPAYTDAISGWRGETARQRLSRMGTDFGVPILVSGVAGEQLGGEEEGTFLDVVSQAMESDLGAPGEDRASLGLTYAGRDRMYNAEPALVLDYQGGEIAPPMEPEDDDQALRNDVEVQRSGGVAAQVEDSDGPLGVGRVGRYDESVTLSLATDVQADDQAGWRLHLGTVDELRWPVIHLNLANPRLSARVEDVLALDAGDRVRVLNPPPWTQERSLDLIVQGYEEQIGLYQWDITLTCTPASPWQVGQISGEEEAPPDAPMRADTAGCELAYGLDEAETLVRVVTTRGPEWVLTDDEADAFPFDVTVGGEVMRVAECVDWVGGTQRLTVERSLNSITKPHRAGTAVRLAYPATAAL